MRWVNRRLPAVGLGGAHRHKANRKRHKFGIRKILRRFYAPQERGIQMKGTYHFVAIGVLVFLIMTGQAFADCVLNGKRLPEGTRIGSLVCEYGQLVEKPEKP
jgi:hypothetical protein